MGYPRLPVEKQCELAPTLLTAMEGKPQPQQDRYAFLIDLISHPVESTVAIQNRSAHLVSLELIQLTNN